MKPRVFIIREDRHAQALYAFLKLNWRSMAEANHPLSVTVGPEKTKRSLQANAYYWGVTLKQISEQGWVDGRQFAPEVWHEEFKERFAPRIDRPFGGSYPMSTSDMTVEQFLTFTRDVEVWASHKPLCVVFTEDLNLARVA